MPFIENIKEILLTALQFPAYARPEYFLKKQVESGWSKHVFLRALKEQCKSYKAYNNLKREQATLSESIINGNEIGLSLKEETNGRLEEFVASFGKQYKYITDDVLTYLMDAIELANHWNEPAVTYSDLQIVSFYETAIGFIRNELKVQAGIEQDPFLLKPNYSKQLTEHLEEDEKEYILFDYYIDCPKPFFDYYTFKHAIRNLLLNSQHADRLKAMLQHTVEDVKFIVNTWNEVIQPVASGGGNLVKTKRYIVFTDNKASYTASFGQSFEKASKGKTHYTNYHLVKFASDAGHIVVNDVIGEEQSNGAISPVIEVKPTVASYAIAHVYWSKYDDTKAITKTNSQSYAEKYGYSANTLFTEYNFYSAKNNREQLTEKKEIKSSVRAFVKRFEDAAELLQDIHSKAHKDALFELNALKLKYESYL